MMLPPKEIIGIIDFVEGSVILVGEATEEQKKIFEEFKKKVEYSYRHRFEEDEPAQP